MSPRVLNKHREGTPLDAVYVGRPSEWGNRFRIGPGRTREQAIAEHRAWIWQQPGIVRRIQRELRGKNLVCSCAPKSCHADVLLFIANLDPLV
jgi:hypothetical protein